MASDNNLLYFGPGRAEPSALVSRFGAEHDLGVVAVTRSADVRALLNRTFPACLVLETTAGPEDATEVLDLIRSLKQDAFTAIVPLIALVPDKKPDLAAECLESGADEVVHAGLPEREKELRMDQVLKRADRDVSVHPTTRLPGTNHIARDMSYRLAAGQEFGVCYADLDHFKEFNDRYGYAYGACPTNSQLPLKSARVREAWDVY